MEISVSFNGSIAIVFPANAIQNKRSDHIMIIKLLTHHNLQKYTLNANKDKLKLSLVCEYY